MPPWQTEDEWSQVHLFFKRSMAAASNRSELNRLARGIASMLAALESELDSLCITNCPACVDNCCMRATVWYDFKDLLFFYCLYGELPPKQIAKKKGHGCTNLQATGCRMPRLQRPFVCTWYLCPAQASDVHRENELSPSKTLKESLVDIQKRRKELEQRFLTGVACLIS